MAVFNFDITPRWKIEELRKRKEQEDQARAQKIAMQQLDAYLSGRQLQDIYTPQESIDILRQANQGVFNPPTSRPVRVIPTIDQYRQEPIKFPPRAEAVTIYNPETQQIETKQIALPSGARTSKVITQPEKRHGARPSAGEQILSPAETNLFYKKVLNLSEEDIASNPDLYPARMTKAAADLLKQHGQGINLADLLKAEGGKTEATANLDSPDKVKEAYRQGLISKDEATKILRDKFGYK